MKYEHRLKTLIDSFESLRKSGDLELEQVDAVKVAIRNLRHALRVGDRRKLEKAVDDFARAFLHAEALRKR